MKVLVIGKLNEAAIKAGNQAGHDTFTYVPNIENVMKVLNECKAELLVADSEEELPESLFAELSSLTRRVRLLLLHREQAYFMVADNSLNTAINYHIPMPKKKQVRSGVVTSC